MDNVTIVQIASVVFGSVAAIMSSFTQIKKTVEKREERIDGNVTYIRSSRLEKITRLGWILLIVFGVSLIAAIITEYLKWQKERKESSEKLTIERQRSDEFKTIISNFYTAKSMLESNLKKSSENVEISSQNLMSTQRALEEVRDIQTKAKAIIDSLSQQLLLQRKLNITSDSLLLTTENTIKQLSELLENADRLLNSFLPFQVFVQYSFHLDSVSNVTSYSYRKTLSEIKKKLEARERFKGSENVEPVWIDSSSINGFRIKNFIPYNGSEIYYYPENLYVALFDTVTNKSISQISFSNPVYEFRFTYDTARAFDLTLRRPPVAGLEVDFVGKIVNIAVLYTIYEITNKKFETLLGITDLPKYYLSIRKEHDFKLKELNLSVGKEFSKFIDLTRHDHPDSSDFYHRKFIGYTYYIHRLTNQDVYTSSDDPVFWFKYNHENWFRK